MAAGQSHHATPPMTSATDGGRGDDDPATPQRPRGQSRARQSGEPFGAHIRKQYEDFGRVIREANIKAE